VKKCSKSDKKRSCHFPDARYVPIGDRGITEHVKNEGSEKLSVSVTHVTRHMIVELCKYSETFVFSS